MAGRSKLRATMRALERRARHSFGVSRAKGSNVGVTGRANVVVAATESEPGAAIAASARQDAAIRQDRGTGAGESDR